MKRPIVGQRHSALKMWTTSMAKQSVIGAPLVYGSATTIARKTDVRTLDQS